MLAYGWLVGSAAVGGSLALAALVLWLTGRAGRPAEGAGPPEAEEGERRCVMLFEAGALFDATPPGRALLDAIEGHGEPQARLLRHLEARFGPRARAIEDLEALGAVEIGIEGGLLLAHWCDGLARIEIADGAAPGARAAPTTRSGTAGAAHLSAVEAELRVLRAAAEACPWPLWHTGPDGVIDWANPAYLERAAPEGAAGPPGWPPAALFEGAAREPAPARAMPPRGGDATGGLRPGGPARRLRAAPSTRAGAAARGGDRAAGTEDDAEAWFDCLARPGTAPGAAIHFAAPAAETVRAERALERFVQTLSQTFAHLPVGLAVFDARRGLSLFNPALTDLTTLPIDFLSARPTLHAFIDRLREARRMPEPRDYRSWRERITALEAASEEGTYLETWNLPAGQTWRVSGRPHPDGAIALMFEDITAEIALTRRFRSELEVGQAVVDAMREAIAVFAPDGVLTLANEAYGRLWGSDPRTSLGDLAVPDASRSWMARCEPSPLWGELRDFVAQMGERAAWTGEARLLDGRRLACRAVPLAGGATLIGFAPESAEGHGHGGPIEGAGDGFEEAAATPAPPPARTVSGPGPAAGAAAARRPAPGATPSPGPATVPAGAAATVPAGTATPAKSHAEPPAPTPGATGGAPSEVPVARGPRRIEARR